MGGGGEVVGLNVSRLLKFLQSQLFCWEISTKCCVQIKCLLVQMGFWVGGGSNAAAISCYWKDFRTGVLCLL